MGIRDRPIAPRSPWKNGYSERLIGSIRRDCLDHVVVFGERHLRHLLNSYQKYYNEAPIAAQGRANPTCCPDHRSHAGGASSGRAASPIFQGVSFRQGQDLCGIAGRMFGVQHAEVKAGHDCPSRKSYPRVAMMQSGQDWCDDNGPRSLDASS
jgi:Integrase core domain